MDKENNLKYIIDNIDTIIIITDEKGYIKYANSSAIQFFGYDNLNDFSGQLCKILFRNLPESLIAVQNIFNNILKSKTVSKKKCIITCKTKNGKNLKVNFIIQKYSINQSEYPCYFAFSGSPVFKKYRKTDIYSKAWNNAGKYLKNSEEYHLIKTLKHKNGELHKISKMKDNLLAIASHDLRSPLCSIKEFIEILKEEPMLNTQYGEIIDLLHRSSDNLLNYIDGLLELAKLNKGDVNLQIKTHEINQVIDEALRTSELSALRKNITIIKKQNEKIIAEIDKAKIVMILNNLISNAIKFSHPNSTIEIIVQKNYANFSIHVIDDGLGVPEEELENIFSEYQKVHSFGTGGEKGNGLGLAICKQLVELHGGKIGVKSKDNSGSEFFFTLPMIYNNTPIE